jgi:putative nucleotidyltransferase with HDIG domain
VNAPNPERVRRITQSLISLPTLPTIAARLLDGEESLESVLSLDPVLAAKLLRLTGRQGGRQEGERLTSISEAISELGETQVRDMGLEESMANIFSKVRAAGDFDLQAFWDHCAGVGKASRLIAGRLCPKLERDAFTAGLLHDIGKIVELQYMEADFANALQQSRESKMELWEAERQILGVDHGQIGAWLAEHWELPRGVQETMQYHHHLDRAQIQPELVATVTLADLLVRILKAGDGGNSAPPVFTPALASFLQARGLEATPEGLRPLLVDVLAELEK